MSDVKFKTICYLGVILAMFIWPLYFPDYITNLVTEAIILALYAVSYNLLLGYAGLLSFGHALFFGTGGYITALVLKHTPETSIWTALLLASTSTASIGFLTGLLLLRHKGAYFALLTLAFNSLFYAVATKWYSVTGGDDGISLARPVINLYFSKVSLMSVSSFYYFTFVVLGALIYFCWFFTKTAIGQSVLLIRENEERMKFLGYDANYTRLILFSLTGMLSGIAGAFYALHFQFISVSAISVDMTTTVLLITFMGGTTKFWGPILGSLVYVYLQDTLSNITDRWPLIMGVIFILMVLFAPKGMSGFFDSIRDRGFININRRFANDGKLIP